MYALRKHQYYYNDCQHSSTNLEAHINNRTYTDFGQSNVFDMISCCRCLTSTDNIELIMNTRVCLLTHHQSVVSY